jgi:hypothetical protein
MYHDFDVGPAYKGPCFNIEKSIVDPGMDIYDPAIAIATIADNPDIPAIIYNSFYQWTSLFIIFLAILLYVPRGIWLQIEGGLMKILANGRTTQLIEKEEDEKEKIIKVYIQGVP